MKFSLTQKLSAWRTGFKSGLFPWFVYVGVGVLGSLLLIYMMAWFGIIPRMGDGHLFSRFLPSVPLLLITLFFMKELYAGAWHCANRLSGIRGLPMRLLIPIHIILFGVVPLTMLSRLLLYFGSYVG